MADPEGELIWRFHDHLCLDEIEKRFRASSLKYQRHSTTVSYFLRMDQEPLWLDSYELHAAYMGGSLGGDPEVDKRYVKNSYGILPSESGPSWIAETVGQAISEDEFYSMTLYSRPDRVLSLQQLSFETKHGRFLIELNVESRMLVLIGTGGAECAPSMLEDLLSPDPVDRSNYLFELFQHNGGLLS